MTVRSGKQEGVAYSLSRWTDVPAAKWSWLREALKEGQMEAFDQATGVPSWWSLKPEDVLGLIFWTKDPTNLISDRQLLEEYPVMIHLTATGWHEVEKGAPNLEASCDLMRKTAAAFGADRMTWRFSPIPDLRRPELVLRFKQLALTALEVGIPDVYVSFLQTNDRIPERRSVEQRLETLWWMSTTVPSLNVRLCNDDRLLDSWGKFGAFPPPNLKSGICAKPEDFKGAVTPPRTEKCGCALLADPFSINESCTFGCLYCYAADETLAEKKRNTIRHLPMVRR